MPTVRYAVRKVSGRHDFMERWCVVAIMTDGRVRRVKYTTTDDRDDALSEAWRLNERLTVLNASGR